MKASPGDRIIIRGHHIGEPDRDGRIVEVRGEDGEPPFVVVWEEDGHTGLFFPGSDAEVHHFEHHLPVPAPDALPVVAPEAGLPVPVEHEG